MNDDAPGWNEMARQIDEVLRALIDAEDSACREVRDHLLDTLRALNTVERPAPEQVISQRQG
jgi:hypothetical protein